MNTDKSYVCPRCGYKTLQKNDMRRHLYSKKRVCPGIISKVDLTDEIKQDIMDNHVYHPPKQTQQQSLNVQININQQINNYIAKLDSVNKLNAYLEYHNQALNQLSSQLENEYGDKRRSIENDTKPISHFQLSTDDIIGIIDKATSANDMLNMNVLYDKPTDRLKIFDEDEWESYAFEQGVKELTKKLQDNYLDDYEIYLLQKFIDSSAFTKQCARECLQEYYKFLVTFDIKPLPLQSKDPNFHQYKEPCYTIYSNVQEKLTISKMHETKRLVYNMIKKNCLANTLELNQTLMDIIKMDESFRNKIIKGL